MTIFDDLALEDNKLLKLLDGGGKNHAEVLGVFAKRIGLYEEFIDRTNDPLEKEVIEAKKTVIISDMGLIATQYEIQSDLAKINSRLDSLESILKSRKT